jgi:hypothetical protein
VDFCADKLGRAWRKLGTTPPMQVIKKPAFVKITHDHSSKLVPSAKKNNDSNYHHVPQQPSIKESAAQPVFESSSDLQIRMMAMAIQRRLAANQQQRDEENVVKIQQGNETGKQVPGGDAVLTTTHPIEHNHDVAENNQHQQTASLSHSGNSTWFADSKKSLDNLPGDTESTLMREPCTKGGFL